MWTQIIKLRLKPGKDAEVNVLMDQLKAAEPPNSGLIRSTTTRDQQDPSMIYTIVTFDSEASARAREQDPQREEALKPIRQFMSEIFDGPPEFIDLDVISEHTGS